MTSARFAWHADRLDPRLASVRYRLLLPLARRVRAAGGAVIYDLCDNIFAAHAANHMSLARVDRSREMMALATHMTFSTATLGGQIAERCTEIPANRRVIPDALDVPVGAGAPPPSWRDRWALHRLRRFLARHPGALHCVWFGKSLGAVSGYVHVDAAARELERFSAHAPVTLTIISNDRAGYLRARDRWKVPTHYCPWSLGSFADALTLHRVSVIPLEKNDYTAGKTLNRPATSLIAGLGVIANDIPSYAELAPFIALGDWQQALERYRVMAPETARQIAAGRDHLAARYSGEAVAREWRALLDAVPARSLQTLSG